MVPLLSLAFLFLLDPGMMGCVIVAGLAVVILSSGIPSIALQS
jgi:hypothetical protein